MLAPRIQSVRFIGAAHAARGTTWALLGQDGGQSIDLGEDTLFVFSDTLVTLQGQRGRPAEITRNSAHFLGNCAAVARESSLEGAMRSLRYFEDDGGFPREIVAPSALERMAGHRFWPQHGIALGDQVYLFYLGIHQFDARSTWGFRPTGSGLARLDPQSGTSERITIDGDWRFWNDAGNLRMGTQVLRDGETLYVFGSVLVEGFAQALLARVPVHEIENVSAYAYAGATEDSWHAGVRDAHPLTGCAQEYSVSYNAYLQAYLMCYAEGFGRELFLRAAPQPWGPYSEPVSAGKLPHREKAEVVALAFEHPRFARNDGKTIVISYCQPHFTQNSLVSVTFA